MEKLVVENQAIQGVKVNGEIIKSKAVILATGGKSYPATGSNGDGYELARQVGHSIEAGQALPGSPGNCSGKVAMELQGLSLKNVKAVVWVNGKKAAEDFGEMLFTHFGSVAPSYLTLSRLVVDELRKEKQGGDHYGPEACPGRTEAGQALAARPG